MEINPLDVQSGASQITDSGPSRSFGAILLERGLVTEQALERGLTIQRQRAKDGIFSRLGSILVEQQSLSAAQVANVLEEQRLTILGCVQCLTQFNVQSYREELSYQCQRCGAQLVSPEALEHVGVEDTVSFGTSSERSRSRRRTTRSAGEAIARLGGYEILGEIARGGMSIVYKARQPGLERLIAIKVLLDLANADEEQVRSFENEARAISRLRHPNIIGIFEYGSVDGVHYYTMDYIEGTTLDRAIILEGLTPESIATIFQKLCEALAYAHSRQIIHRDVKPRNIMVDRRGEPILIDFGIAKAVGHEESADAELVGSPAYLAPEYIERRSPYDARCEVYAIGASLYQILSGRHPHDDANTQRILNNIKSKPPAPLRSIAPSVPADLGRITATAMSYDREGRYAEPSAVAQDLRRFLEGEEVLANGSQLYRLWRRQRIKLLSLFVVFMALILVFMSGYFSRAVSQGRESNRSLINDRDRWRLRWAYARLDLAKSQKAAGQLLRARETLREILTLTPRAPDEVMDLIQAVERELKRPGKRPN